MTTTPTGPTEENYTLEPPYILNAYLRYKKAINFGEDALTARDEMYARQAFYAGFVGALQFTQGLAGEPLHVTDQVSDDINKEIGVYNEANERMANSLGISGEKI